MIVKIIPNDLTGEIVNWMAKFDDTPPMKGDFVRDDSGVVYVVRKRIFDCGKNTLEVVIERAKEQWLYEDD